MSLADRKRIELTAKLSSISDELSAWVDASAEGEVLEKHHTQVGRLNTSIQIAIEAVAPLLAPGVNVLSTWTAVEERVLMIHQVWDQFRTKLAHRYVPTLRSHLDVADDLAEACYRPAVDVAIGAGVVAEGAVREPPLVYFTSFATPFTMVRGSTDVTVDAAVLSDDQLAVALRQLPVPIIGIPWFQLDHLPDTVIVAHEVGHDVEADLGLTDRIVELVVGAVPDRADQWVSWASEVFADVWGTLGAGEGFVSALLDLIATPPVVEPATTTGRYPPAPLRAVVVCGVLELIGADGAGFLRRWEDERGSLGDPADVEAARAVTRALFDGPYRAFDEQGLRHALPPRPPTEATDDVVRLGRQMTLLGEDPRGLVAAAALAFAKDPEAYVLGELGQIVRERVVALREQGTRDTLGIRGLDAIDDDPVAMFAAYDRAAGLALLDLLGTS